MSPLAARIHAALPQTQCTRCGYADCAGYAEAIAGDEADIHQCPPGGAEGIQRLAAITGRAARPLGAEFGVEGPRRMAIIDEAWCIGCTLCLDACPTDAILGMHKRMHTVIEPHCTGCELCIPVCPVDCISLEDVTPGRSGWQAWSQQQADEALARYRIHAVRRRIDNPLEQDMPAQPPADAEARKRAIVAAALARARASRSPAAPAKPSEP